MKAAIRSAVSATDIEACRALFTEYGDWLSEDVCLAGFAAEVAALPGKYAPSHGGQMLLATLGDEPAGCVAFRKFDDTAAEAKRLWVRPQFRRDGVGVALLKAMEQEAKAAGYQKVVFDTLPKMRDALRIYEAYGFVRRDAYAEGEAPGLIYFEKQL